MSNASRAWGLTTGVGSSAAWAGQQITGQHRDEWPSSASGQGWMFAHYGDASIASGGALWQTGTVNGYAQEGALEGALGQDEAGRAVWSTEPAPSSVAVADEWAWIAEYEKLVRPQDESGALTVADELGGTGADAWISPPAAPPGPALGSPFRTPPLLPYPLSPSPSPAWADIPQEYGFFMPAPDVREPVIARASDTPTLVTSGAYSARFASLPSTPPGKHRCIPQGWRPNTPAGMPAGQPLTSAAPAIATASHLPTPGSASYSEWSPYSVNGVIPQHVPFSNDGQPFDCAASPAGNVQGLPTPRWSISSEPGPSPDVPSVMRSAGQEARNGYVRKQNGSKTKRTRAGSKGKGKAAAMGRKKLTKKELDLKEARRIGYQHTTPADDEQQGDTGPELPPGVTLSARDARDFTLMEDGFLAYNGPG